MPIPQETDVIVVGAGPAGLFAVFACGMVRLKCHVVDTLEAVGGQCMALYPDKPIYDIPAHPNILAADLIEQLRQQAAPFAPVYHLGRQVVTLDRQQDGRWRAGLNSGDAILAPAVIIAAGVGAFGPNRPPLAGIEQYEGKGISYLVVRRDDYRGKRVVIAGGGDSAVDWALSLAEVADQVMVVHRRPKFRAAPESAARLQQMAVSGRIELVIPYQLHSLEGDGERLTAVIVATVDAKTRRLETDALLPFFGLASHPGPVAEWGLAMDGHHILVDQRSCATSVPGILAIGDVASYPGKLKLILGGFSEAATAARSAHDLVHPDEILHFEHSTTSGIPSAPSNE